jgi:hypothetical protein
MPDVGPGLVKAGGKKGEKEDHTYGGELCRTVTPPSADCESSILSVVD